jgi:flagellar motility protein MotE (MotC chaperone)
VRPRELAILVLLAPALLAADTEPAAKPASAAKAAVKDGAAKSAKDGSAQTTAKDGEVAASEPTQAELDAAIAQRAAESLDLEAKRAALQLLESDLTRKLDELAKLQGELGSSLEANGAERAKQESAGDSGPDVQKLVQLYQAMKPKNAANLLEQLPLAVSTPILRAMKARSAGKILNEMESSKAVLISKRLAESKS